MHKSQKEYVLEYLIKHGTIDDRRSVYDLGIHDLQHAIMVLRNEGYKITDKWIKGINRHGNRTHYKEYRLEN